MRHLMTAGAIMLALIAFHPATAFAKGSGSGSSGSGSSGSGSQGSGQKGGWNSNWHGNWYPSYGWYPGYGPGYARYPYSVQRPIVENPLPLANFSGGPIKITNPANSKAALSYTLNGLSYTIQPGQSQDIREDRSWVIEFSRGANFGAARYGLEPGLYTFSGTERGWELYHTPLEETQPPAAPTNPPPPAPPRSGP
jgi:hypothetical protein